MIPTAAHLSGIQAVIFDMDGTLVDSEPYTGMSVQRLLDAQGIADPDLDMSAFHGVTWQAISDALVARHPRLAGVCTPDRLEAVFEDLWEETPPPFILGAKAAMVAAKAVARTAICTSSRSAAVTRLVSARGLGPHLDGVICADDFGPSKPDPACFQLTAERLGVAPDRCLVFEDSVAGQTAAARAGMTVVGIGPLRMGDHAPRYAIPHYEALPAGFFAGITRA
jgi:beta-phosphoglucomutase